MRSSCYADENPLDGTDPSGMCSGSVKVGVVSLSYGYANVNKISAAYKTAMKTRNVGGDTLASGNSASTQLAALADICAGNSKLCGSSLTNELEFVDGIPGTPLQVNHPSEVNNAAAAAGVEVSNAVAHHLAGASWLAPERAPYALVEHSFSALAA